MKLIQEVHKRCECVVTFPAPPSQVHLSPVPLQLVTLQEAKLLLNEDDYLIKAVYDYWVRKRKNCRGPSLIPQIKQEKRDGSTNNDPYVAFRRRTEKMQTRKVTWQILLLEILNFSLGRNNLDPCPASCRGQFTIHPFFELKLRSWHTNNLLGWKLPFQ